MTSSSLDFGDWKVLDPDRNYLGLSYGEWARNWVNWLMHSDPDHYNNGPVLFLRGIDFEKTYDYRSFIRIGKNRLTMSTDQALLCVLLACWIDIRHHETAEDHEKRLSRTYNLITHGDHPPSPEQFTIDGKPFPGQLNDFLVVAPEFKIHIPAPSYGESLGNYLDVPLTEPGDWDCALGGYFVILKPKKEGTYVIASHAAAENGYTTETLAEVEVHGTTREELSVYHGNRMKETILDIISDKEQETGMPGTLKIAALDDQDQKRAERVANYLNALNRSHGLTSHRDKGSKK